MAHKTEISGTYYEVTGGKTMVDGTGYEISSGKTMVDGTGYDVNFGGDVSITLKKCTSLPNYALANVDFSDTRYMLCASQLIGKDTTVVVQSGTQITIYEGSGVTSFKVTVNGSQVFYSTKSGEAYTYLVPRGISAVTISASSQGSSGGNNGAVTVAITES